MPTACPLLDFIALSGAPLPPSPSALGLVQIHCLVFIPRVGAAKERFIHEAKAASGLDHSNICTIHEIGETEDGRSFIIMACYDGKTLGDLIRATHELPLQVQQILDITIQVAQGLARAHEAGIRIR